jgi:ABC-type glycerol-3-phosphate transport system permease component
MAVTAERARVTVPARRPRTAGARLGTVVRALVILVVCVLVLFPVYWMVLSAFQPEGKTLSFPPPIIPVGFNGGAISQLFRDQPIASWLGHSLFVALISVAITLVLSAVGAYLLGRLEWHGKLAFGLLLLFTQICRGR